MEESKSGHLASEPEQLLKLPRRMTKRKIDSSEIQNLTAPPSTQASLFETLLEAAKRTVVNATVPETLVQIGGGGSPYLIASEKNVVSVTKGTHSFSKFFELVDVALSNPSFRDQSPYTPRYLIKDSSHDSYLCTTREECLARLSQITDSFCYISRFIKSKGPKPILYRVSYQIGRGISVYQLKNNRRIDLLRRFTAQRKNDFQTKQISIYKHNAVDFVYAGKLLKASFSPYLPYRSVLDPRGCKSAKISPRLSPIRTSRPSTKDHKMHRVITKQPTRRLSTETLLHDLEFIVVTTDLDHCKVYKIEDHIPELESLVTSLLASLERAYKTKTVTEFTVDCTNAEDGGWFAVETVGLMWQDDGKRQIQERNIKRRFKNIEKVQLDVAEVTRIEPPMFQHSVSERAIMEAEEHSQVRWPPGTSPVASPRQSGRQETLMTSHLLTVQTKFDYLLNQARRSKILSRNLVTELEAAQKNSYLMEQLIDNALCKVIPEENRTNKKEFTAMKETLLEILSGHFRNVVKSTKIAMLRKLGMTESQYEGLIGVVVQEAGPLKFPKENLDLITERLNSFLINEEEENN